MAWDAKEIRGRQSAAKEKRARMRPYIDQAMDYAMPWRRDQKRGRDTFDRLFDSSGPNGVNKFASRLQRDLTPPFSRWFKLEGGPLIPADQLDEVNRQLEPITDVLHALLDHSSFPKASHEMYSDLSIGTGALLALEGDDREPVRWTAVPPWEDLDIEEGPTGRIENVYWERAYPAHALRRLWPGAKWPAKIEAAIAQRATDRVKILQATYYDEDLRGWRLAVVACGEDAEDAIVWESTHRTNPWIIPRWWTTPGQTWGYGPLLLTLPDIKTANKTVEMILKAAALSLAPPLMVLHDGVVNPDTLRLTPHAMIRVARTGGPMGRSIEPIDLGSRMDLGQIVLQDLRQNISKNLLARELPPDTGAVRSPTEITARLQELAFDTGSAFGRMNHEFVPQVIARLIDIADRKKIATIDFRTLNVDQLVLKVKVTSPLAQVQNLEDVESVVRYWELLRAVLGDQGFPMVANLEESRRLGPLMGAPSWATRSRSESAAMQHMAGQAMAQVAAAGGDPNNVVKLAVGQ